MSTEERDQPRGQIPRPGVPAPGAPRPAPPRSGVRRLVVGLVVVAVLGACVYGGLRLLRGPLSPLVAPLLSTMEEPDRSKRPEFGMPFACGERWRLTTYAAHNPEDMKLDFFRVGGPTEGGVVRASASGRIVMLPSPGGVKIDHGHGWYSLSLHMGDISVGVGDEVEAGQAIGRVGAVGTQTAHLHYEQLFDADGNGRVNVATDEIVYPIIQGTEYRLTAESEAPVVESATACAPSTAG